jgi:hypothetical protein
MWTQTQQQWMMGDTGAEMSRDQASMVNLDVDGRVIVKLVSQGDRMLKRVQVQLRAFDNHSS